MKIKQSLAKRDWRLYHNPVGSKSPELCYWIHEYRNGEMVRSVLMPPLNREDAHAIAALPQLYAACLEVMRADAHAQFEPDMMVKIEAWSRVVAQARAALDAANAADEQP